jgi:hypothetical protein
MRAILVVAALLAAAAAAAAAAAQPRFQVLNSFNTSDCAGALPYNITIPLGECLNNHDFDKVSCGRLQGCLATLSRPSPYIAYAALVNCTAAPAMDLSVRGALIDGGAGLRLHVYPLQKTCKYLGVPMTFHEKNKCASTFALSKHCGIAGSSISWM